MSTTNKKIAGIALIVVGLAGVILCVIITGDTSGPGAATNWETTSNVPVATTDQNFVVVGVFGLVSLIMGCVLTMHSFMTDGETVVEHEIEKEQGEIPTQPKISEVINGNHDNSCPACREEIFRPDTGRDKNRGVPGVHRLLDSPY